LERHRVSWLLYFGASLVWQGYGIATAFRIAPVMRPLFDALGSPLPGATTGLLQTYLLWPAVPALFGLFGWRTWRRGMDRPSWDFALLGASIVVAMILQAWANVAWFQPMFTTLRKIG